MCHDLITYFVTLISPKKSQLSFIFINVYAFLSLNIIIVNVGKIGKKINFILPINFHMFS